MFMDRAEEEQRSTFYTANAAELCMSYQARNKSFKNKRKTGTYEYVRTSTSSTAVKDILGYSARNGRFKRLEPHFQI